MKAKICVPLGREPAAVPPQQAKARGSEGLTRVPAAPAGGQLSPRHPYPEAGAAPKRESGAPPRQMTPRAAPEMPAREGRGAPATAPLVQEVIPPMPTRSKMDVAGALSPLQEERTELPRQSGRGAPAGHPPAGTKPPAPPEAAKQEGEDAPALIEYEVPQIPAFPEKKSTVVSVLTGQEISFHGEPREEKHPEPPARAEERPSPGPHEPPEPLPRTRYVPLSATAAEEERADTASTAPGGRGSFQIHGEAFPAKPAAPWPDAGGDGLAPLLQELIRRELADWHYYRKLGEKAGSAAEKTVAAMAADEWQCAKRLAAAYFLVTGAHYWPEKTEPAEPPAYLMALRERFHAEQRDAERYGTVARDCRDECFCEMFAEAAAQNRRHAQQIRLLVEQF